MTAPLNLDALEAAARAVPFGADHWYIEKDIGNVLAVNIEEDAKFIVAASPAVVLELVRRLRAAEAQLAAYEGAAADDAMRQMERAR